MSGESSQDIDSSTGKVITSGVPVAHTDVVDGVSVGHHAEPEHVDGSTGNEAPPPAADPPPEKPPKLALGDIYAKAKTGRDSQISEDMENMTAEGRADHVARLEAEAGGGPDPFAEPPTTEPPPAVPPVAAAPKAAPIIPENIPAQGIDPAPEMTTINVYGMREEVPTADIVAAGGISTYQKERAADIKLQRLTTFEASLRGLDSQLSERAANLEREAQTPAQAGTGVTESSPTDAQGDTADIDALSTQLTNAIYSGDREAAQSQIKSVLASVRTDAVRAAQAVVPQPAAASGPTAEQIAADTRARNEANAVFLNEFSDLDTPVLKKAALDMVQAVSADPIMRDRPLSEITREACSRVREDVFKGVAPPPVIPAVPGTQNPLITAPVQAAGPNDLGTRLDLKRRTVVTPSTEAHGRVVEPTATDQRPPTNAEVVANMRKARGQPA